MTLNTYGSLPYPGFSWSMNHHMGVANERNVHNLLWAANQYRHSADPVAEINNYAIANNLFTKNVRQDTRQAETWRDYQQILPELGLIISTSVRGGINLTPLGLALIERTITYDELVTLQALRFQYPNGHKTPISPALRKKLKGTQFEKFGTLTTIQSQADVEIRPTVLIWRVLRALQEGGHDPILTLKEIQAFLVPCFRHEFTGDAIQAICEHRQNGNLLSSTKVSRDVQEWRQWLRITPLFSSPNSDSIRISEFGTTVSSEIDQICETLENSDSFWKPDGSAADFKIEWFAEYGSIDVNIDLVPNATSTIIPRAEVEPQTISNRDLPRKIKLRPFDSTNLASNRGEQEREKGDVEIVYDAALSLEQYVLHDRMVELIARTCTNNGGKVFHDPKTVDLLINFRAHEFLVEVKSVTPGNFVIRLRLALGQLLHYEYLRSTDSDAPRRKVVAFAARIPTTSWSVPFVKGFLNWDLLSLGKRGIQVQSSFSLSNILFAESKEQSLFDLM